MSQIDAIRPLAHATQRRRRDIRAALTAREIRFRDLDLAEPALRNLPVLELVARLPWKSNAQSHHRSPSYRPAERILHHAGIPLSFTFGWLTERQREALVRFVADLCPSQREGA